MVGIRRGEIAADITEARLAVHAFKVIAPRRPLDHNATRRIWTFLPFGASGTLVERRLSGVGLLVAGAASAWAMEVVILTPGPAVRALKLV